MNGFRRKIVGRGKKTKETMESSRQATSLHLECDEAQSKPKNDDLHKKGLVAHLEV